MCKDTYMVKSKCLYYLDSKYPSCSPQRPPMAPISYLSFQCHFTDIHKDKFLLKTEMTLYHKHSITQYTCHFHAHCVHTASNSKHLHFFACRFLLIAGVLSDCTGAGCSARKLMPASRS